MVRVLFWVHGGGLGEKGGWEWRNCVFTMRQILYDCSDAGGIAIVKKVSRDSKRL